MKSAASPSEQRGIVVGLNALLPAVLPSSQRFAATGDYAVNGVL